MHPKTSCSSCRLRDLCMPMGLNHEEMRQIDSMVSTRVKVPRGNYLYFAGGGFESLYAVRLGFFKTTLGAADGREQVSGFYMAGDLLGLDGVANALHTSNAIALEDSEVCVLHMQAITDLSRHVHSLQHHVQKVMSREIVRDHDHMFMLGSMDAQARVASFLLQLLTRQHSRGQASDALELRMTREDIGSYLGLTIETVSRSLGKLTKNGIISVNLRSVRVLQPLALHHAAEHAQQPHCAQLVLHTHAQQHLLAETA